MKACYLISQLAERSGHNSFPKSCIISHLDDAFTTINKNLTSVLVHKYFIPFGLYKMIQGREVVTYDFTLMKSNRLQTVMRTLDLRNRNSTIPMDSDNPLL